MFYNNRGLHPGIQNELGNLRTMTYDPAANMLTLESFGSQTITNVYDPTNRLLARNYMNGTIASWLYDANSNVIMTVAPATQYGTTFAFDALDRPAGRTDHGGLNVAWRYDAAGRRSGLTNPDGGLFSYAYSAIDQLTFLERPGGYTSTLAYDPASRLSWVKHNSGLAYSYAYDAANQILNVLSAESSTLITSTSYGYDRVGNRTTMQTLSGSNSAYNYDAKNRLIQDDTTGTNVHNYTYSYDSVDNRLSTTEPSGYVAYSYDAANRITTSVNASGTTTYAYTLEGTQSQVSEPPGGSLYTFVQDVEYRLASQTATPGGTRNWYYDADGKLQYYSGPSPAGTVTLVWDGDDYLQVRM